MALYNVEKKSVKTDAMCFECEHYDKQSKKCMGIGKACFEYDTITGTCIDAVTGMKFKPNENER